MALRLSEHYVSVQGEGPNTGILTQFVRFAGCNLRCPGWPCDTPFAIEPSIWKTESEKVEPGDLVGRVQELANSTGATNICLTGGEPFMQKEDDLKAFVEELKRAANPYYSVECFSNGSFIYPHWSHQHMSIHMDWKLGGSGEGGKHDYERMLNARKLSGMAGDSIKFVVKDEDDLLEVYRITLVLRQDNHIYVPLWIGAAWGHMEDWKIIEFIKLTTLPLRLNVQLHKHIWKPDERKV